MDGSFFFKSDGNNLQGLCSTYVEDILQLGYKSFIEDTKVTKQTLKWNPRQFTRIRFTGIDIGKIQYSYIIHQEEYISNLAPTNLTASFPDFCSLDARITWSILSRPDVSCAVAKFAQITKDMFNKQHTEYIKSIKETVKYFLNSKEVVLQYPKLDEGSMRIQVNYSDAFFGDNKDGRSQLGFIVFFTDKSNEYQPITWASYKSKRVTRSVLGHPYWLPPQTKLRILDNIHGPSLP